MTPKEEVALRKRIEALEAAQPKPTPRMPTAEEIAEHNDRMHQMREGRMNAATPPSALQAMVEAEPKGFHVGGHAGQPRTHRQARHDPDTAER